MAEGRTATDSGDERKQLGCKEFMIIDVSPAIEPGQWPECCIYRVPKLLRSVKPKAYTPQLVHIGPLHYSMQQPEDIEIQKLRYLKEFCDRTEKSQNDLADIIQSDELKIRHCYSETFDQINSEEFVKMILLDAIFIIEFILRSRVNVKGYKDDILSIPCLAYNIGYDLILLENQLPYFVLKKLYNLARNVGQENQQGQAPADPFLKLVCDFLFQNPDAVPEGKEGKHLTDLLRTYYNLPHLSSKFSKNVDYKEVCRATKLDEVGVKFKVAPARSGLLDIKLKKKIRYLDWCPCLTFSWLLDCFCLKCFPCLELMQPVIEIPRLVIEDGTEVIFRNIMALEQRHYPMEAHFCNYIMLLDYFVDNEKGIEFLVEKNIIVNMLVTNIEAATVIKRLCLEILTVGSCYVEVIEGLRSHYDDDWSRIMVTTTRVYFGDFWRVAATVTGLIVFANSLWGILQPFVLKK